MFSHTPWLMVTSCITREALAKKKVVSLCETRTDWWPNRVSWLLKQITKCPHHLWALIPKFLIDATIPTSRAAEVPADGGNQRRDCAGLEEAFERSNWKATVSTLWIHWKKLGIPKVTTGCFNTMVYSNDLRMIWNLHIHPSIYIYTYTYIYIYIYIHIYIYTYIDKCT